MMTRIPFETQMRDAGVQMLTDFKQATSIKLQVYRGRPLLIAPPTAFIESMGETVSWSPGLRQRNVRMTFKMVWGLFDSAEAVNQRDYFMDNFIDWVSDNPHAAGGATIFGDMIIDDDPAFTPDWGDDRQRNATFFSSSLTLEGFAGGY
jgi:hypothetical protein